MHVAKLLHVDEQTDDTRQALEQSGATIGDSVPNTTISAIMTVACHKLSLYTTKKYLVEAE